MVEHADFGVLVQGAPVEPEAAGGREDPAVRDWHRTRTWEFPAG